jgi:hypothetical protein
MQMNNLAMTNEEINIWWAETEVRAPYPEPSIEFASASIGPHGSL